MSPRKVILLVVLALVASVSVASASTATFSQKTVDPGTGPAEPGVKIDPSGGVMYAYDFPGSLQLFVSSDGTKWFRAARTQGGGGDADIALGPPGVVYGADLLDTKSNTTIPVSVSTNFGKTFNKPVLVDPTAKQLPWDRQWIGARGSRVVVSALAEATGSTSVAATEGDVVAWTSTDAAKHFNKGVVVAHDVTEGGPMVFAPDGALWMSMFVSGMTGESVIQLAKSTNGGLSWTTVVAARETNARPLPYDPAHFPVIAFDGRNGAYVAFTMCEGTPLFHTSNCHVDVVSSTNNGRSWSKPKQLSTAGHSALFPWVATRSGGTPATGADVVFYEANQTKGLPDPGPDLGGPQTTWNVVMAQTRDGGKTWGRSTVAANFHKGSICTEGLGCAGPQQLGVLNAPTPFDRRDLDFFMVAVDRTGTALVIYPKDRPIVQTDPTSVLIASVDVVVAKQSGGTKL